MARVRMFLLRGNHGASITVKMEDGVLPKACFTRCRWEEGRVSGGHTCSRLKRRMNGSGVRYHVFPFFFICRNGERQKAIDGYEE